MNHPRKTLLLSAAACLVAIATPALAQDAATGAHGHHRAAPKVRQVADEIAPTATAEVGESNCHLEIVHVVGITQPNYQTMCGPR